MSGATEERRLYGILAEFEKPDALLAAATRVRDAGYKATDAFAPFPMEGLPEAIGERHSSAGWIMLIAGIVGGCSVYALQYWVSVIAYPLNVGGRPLHSWPAFIPPTFETTILFASIAGLIGMLVLCRLPKLHHPLFEIPRFKKASDDAFFLCIESRDKRFDAMTVRQLLRDCGAKEVWDVPATD